MCEGAGHGPHEPSIADMISTGGILSLRLRRRALRRGFERGRLRGGCPLRPLDGPWGEGASNVRSGSRAGADLDPMGFDGDVMALITPLMDRGRDNHDERRGDQAIGQGDMRRTWTWVI